MASAPNSRICRRKWLLVDRGARAPRHPGKIWGRDPTYCSCLWIIGSRALKFRWNSYHSSLVCWGTPEIFHYVYPNMNTEGGRDVQFPVRGTKVNRGEGVRRAPSDSGAWVAPGVSDFLSNPVSSGLATPCYCVNCQAGEIGFGQRRIQIILDICSPLNQTSNRSLWPGE